MALAMLAALLLLLRLLVPMAPLPAPPMDALAELLAGGGICHADPGAPAPAQDEATCRLCPLCGGPVPLVLASPPALPAPALLPETLRQWRPPATAPPAAPNRIARSRAPPALHG